MGTSCGRMQASHMLISVPKLWLQVTNWIFGTPAVKLAAARFHTSQATSREHRTPHLMQVYATWHLLRLLTPTLKDVPIQKTRRTPVLAIEAFSLSELERVTCLQT